MKYTPEFTEPLQTEINDRFKLSTLQHTMTVKDTVVARRGETVLFDSKENSSMLICHMSNEEHRVLAAALYELFRDYDVTLKEYPTPMRDISLDKENWMDLKHKSYLVDNRERKYALDTCQRCHCSTGRNNIEPMIECHADDGAGYGYCEDDSYVHIHTLEPVESNGFIVEMANIPAQICDDCATEFRKWWNEPLNY